jgi:two-component system, OmpR family, phosphate regulon sensor histidine kinase PhoR
MIPELTIASVAGLLLWWQRRRSQVRVSSLLRQNERLLREQAGLSQGLMARQEAVLNAMVEGVIVVDTHQRIILANPAMRGLIQEEMPLIGQTLMVALRHHQLQEIAQSTLQQQEARSMEIELPSLSTQSRFLQVNSAVMQDAEGRVTGAIMVFHDISKLKRMEQARTELIGNVSHELRTPLTIIRGYAETLRELKPEPAMVQKFAGTIEQHALRLTDLVEDLMVVSGFETGQLQLRFQPVQLMDLVLEVMELLKSRAAERGVTLTHEVPEAAVVVADESRLLQVMQNLMENAIKYGRAGGQVTVFTHWPAADCVELIVADDGPGIPLDARPRVFERFYRVDKARSRDQGGTGLGLAIVKHIIQAHGGSVRLEVNEPTGCRFIITLPMNPPEGRL